MNKDILIRKKVMKLFWPPVNIKKIPSKPTMKFAKNENGHLICWTYEHLEPYPNYSSAYKMALLFDKMSQRKLWKIFENWLIENKGMTIINFMQDLSKQEQRDLIAEWAESEDV